MTFATNMQAVALNLLRGYGQAVTLSRSVEGVYIPETAETAAASDTTYSGYIHTSPFSTSEVDGVTILATDISAYLYSTTLPLSGDTVSIDNVSYRVMQVNQLKAQGIKIVYRLQLRV